MQSRLHSFFEATANISFGLAISMLANAIVFPLFGFHVTATQNVAISCIYTAISLVRSYALRRLFNAISTRGWN